MALYNRLLAVPANGEDKLPVHQFLAVVREFRAGALTQQQAQDIISVLSGSPLSAQDVTDLQALLATVPTGTTTANRLDRIDRLARIEGVLTLADVMAAGYTTDALLRAKLGVT